MGQYIYVLVILMAQYSLQQNIQANLSTINTFEVKMEDESYNIALGKESVVVRRFGDESTYFYELNSKGINNGLCNAHQPFIRFDILGKLSLSNKLGFKSHTPQISYTFDYVQVDNYLYIVGGEDTLYYCSINLNSTNSDICDNLSQINLNISQLVNHLFDVIYIQQTETILLITKSSQLVFVDVTNRLNPVKKDTIDLNTVLQKKVQIFDCMIYKNHFLLSLGLDGAYVLDITQSDHIIIKHVFNEQFFNLKQIFIYTITYEGNLLFMVERLSNRIYIIDSLDVASPKTLSYITVDNIIYQAEIMNRSLMIITKSKNTNKYFFEEYIEDWNKPGNFILNRIVRIYSASINLSMNQKYAFISYENFIGVYRHSIPTSFTTNMQLLYSSFLAEGILDASILKYKTQTGQEEEYVILIAGDDMYFIKFYNERPGIYCATQYQQDIQSAKYQFNYTIYQQECNIDSLVSQHNGLDKTYTKCIQQGDIEVIVQISVFNSEYQALVIGLSVGGVIILIACICFGCKVNKLKYKKLQSNEHTNQTESDPQKIQENISLDKIDKYVNNP